MLDKNVIKPLLEKQQYDEILNILTQEYRDILQNFFKKHNIAYTEKDTMLDLILKLKTYFPEYKGFASLLSTALFAEDMDVSDRIATLLDGYENILKQLT